MAYVFILCFTALFVMYFNGQHRQLMGDPKASAYWHFWGWAMRAMVVICTLWYGWPHWKPVAMAAALSLPVFDIGINLVALRQGVFYVGTTSRWDRKVGHMKWAIYLILIILAFTINVVPWNAEG